MKKNLVLILFICFCFAGLKVTAQEKNDLLQSKQDRFSENKTLIDKSKQQVYINAKIWLVFSLARFDIAIDNNLVEVRADVQLRRGSRKGKLIRVADVRINNQRLDFKKDRFKRKRILPGKLLDTVVLKLHIPGGPCIRQVITIPTWTKLQEPKPAIYDGTSDLNINWVFSKCGTHVNLSVNNFHTGKLLLKEIELAAKSFKLPVKSLPAGESLLRIVVIEPWFHVKKMLDPMVTLDSEIRVISWSQSFVRVKK